MGDVFEAPAPAHGRVRSDRMTGTARETTPLEPETLLPEQLDLPAASRRKASACSCWRCSRTPSTAIAGIAGPATRPRGSCSTRRAPGWSRGITTRSSPSRASARPSTSTPTISADTCARRVRLATGGDDGRPREHNPTHLAEATQDETTADTARARLPETPLGLSYGKLTNRLLKSDAFAASPSSGLTPKISSTVRSVELWV